MPPIPEDLLDFVTLDDSVLPVKSELYAKSKSGPVVPVVNNGPDDYQTPPEAIVPLLQFIQPGWTVWEPACGSGQLVREFKRRGYDVIGTDMLTDQSFLDYEPEKYDCIITNPPYSIKQQFLERVYSLGKPFAFLMPLAALETQKRQSLYKKYGLELLIPNRRIHFSVPVSALTPAGASKSGSYFLTAWFTWGFNIGQNLSFVDIPA